MFIISCTTYHSTNYNNVRDPRIRDLKCRYKVEKIHWSFSPIALAIYRRTFYILRETPYFKFFSHEWTNNAKLLVSHRLTDRNVYRLCQNLLIVLYKNPTSSSCDIPRCRESYSRNSGWEAGLSGVDLPRDEYDDGTRSRSLACKTLLRRADQNFARISSDFDEEANYFTVRCRPVYTASVHLYDAALMYHDAFRYPSAGSSSSNLLMPGKEMLILITFVDMYCAK